MKTALQRLLVAVLTVALAVTMFPFPAFAVEGSDVESMDGQPTVQEDQPPAQEDQQIEKDYEKSAVQQQAKRTIMLYDCGSNLETDNGLATYNLLQILASSFSSTGNIKFLVMTGGSHKWQIDKKNLVFPDDVALPEDAVVEYDPNQLRYLDPLEPKSQVSNMYNQIWEAKGVDAKDENGNDDENAGKMVLLDGNGITGDENVAVKSENELMSDPATLKAFINYGAANYPAEKYDLILWDHGGGPVGGYGSDEHRDDLDDWTLPSIMSFEGIVDALSDNAVTNNDADGDGKMDKFDFVDFDACLMNSVELALTMADYTDYYIASAETEPGYGQYYGPRAKRDGKQYIGWLDELGSDPDYDTFELGKVIVDDFYNFYEKETGDGHAQEGTLAVIDTQAMADSQFVNALSEMVRVLRGEAGNMEEDGLHFYDELKSYYNSIEYGGSELFDLGTLAALLSVVNCEVSEEHMDEPDNYYINANDYHDITRTINRLLDPSSNNAFMYAKGTSGITTEDLYYRTLDDQLGFGKLGSTGMSIYFPGLDMTMSAADYFKKMDPVINGMSNGARKTLLKEYEAAVAYYSLILYSGKTVDRMINDEEDDFEAVDKSDVDFDLVLGEMKGLFGNWDSLVVPCMKKIGIDEEALLEWYHVLIPQQIEDAVDGKEVTVERLDQQESGACRITVNQAKKRIIESVERNIYVELPAMERFVGSLTPEEQEAVNSVGQLSVGSIEGKLVSQPEGSSIRDLVRWYNESGGVWDIDPLEEKWYAVNDAGGKMHVASIYLSDEDGIYVPAIIGTGEEGIDTSGLIMLEFDPQDGHKLNSLYYMNTDAGPVQVELKSLTRDLTVMPVIVAKRMFQSDIYVPISESSFTISAGNGDSISLDYIDIEKIKDIGDTNNDGKAIDSAVTITDIYDYKIQVSDRIQIKKARIRPAVFTGEELEPEVVYRGEVLQKGVDYILEKEKLYDPEMGLLYEPAFIEPGSYKVLLFGKGRFTGRKYDYIFNIVQAEDAAQTLVDEAQTKLETAQTATQQAVESDSQKKWDATYEKLVDCQNVLSEAQEQLLLTQDSLSKEKKKQLKEDIAKLNEQISKLNNQLAKVQVIDISAYTATLSKISCQYTGKAIKPSVKVFGLSSKNYTVKYSKNKKIGTATVTVKAKGKQYKGKITKTFEITKKNNTLAVKGKTATVKYKKLKKKARTLKVKKVIKFKKKGQGAKSYEKVSGDESITINAKTGKVKIKKGLKKGTYRVEVKVKAKGNKTHKTSDWKTVTFKVKVK